MIVWYKEDLNENQSFLTSLAILFGLVATGDLAYGIRRWKVSTDESVRLFARRASTSLAVAWVPDGKCIASGHDGGMICFWTASTNECDGLISAHQTATLSLALSPDGSHLATGGGVIRIWDSQTGNLISAFGLNEKSVYVKLAWSNSGTNKQKDCFGRCNGGQRIFRLPHKKVLRICNKKSGELNASPLFHLTVL